MPLVAADGPADLAGQLARATGVAVSRCDPIGGGHGASHYRASLADGRELFIKAGDSAAALRAEAHGLSWLNQAGAVPLPEVITIQKEFLAVLWLPSASADVAAARRFGRELAELHAAGADAFGTPWPGFIASLPLPGDRAEHWPSWYAQYRLLPYCRLGRDDGVLTAADATLIEAVTDRIGDLAGSAEPPSRIHGDCWSGNVLWSGGRGWLIDPAAQGGHRESDLAMLALFGAPYLEQILAAYQEVAPLASGWQARVPLHQLHPLLVHACLFGGSYRDAVVTAARAALAR